MKQIMNQIMAVVSLHIFLCFGQNLQPGSESSPAGGGIICSPQNHITIDVPSCLENHTVRHIVRKLDRLEVTASAIRQALVEMEGSPSSTQGKSDTGARSNHQDCYDVLQGGHSTSGSYIIQPDDDLDSFRVYCDMTTDNGGWTVFQRRIDGSMNFFRDWDSYKNGFGHVNAEFWLGNDRLFRLTNQKKYRLRVDMEDMDGNTAFAVYEYFRIGDELSHYKLVLGPFTGTAGDSMGGHSKTPFSTAERDNDQSQGNCASTYKGGWWYTDCHQSNLNGLYLEGEHSSYANGVNWLTFKGHNYSLKFTEMKIRPLL
ncbi:fibrinogen C domain-containing protein 1-like [Ptychodera flava]|uniref:fibrinogen C domain-containing protein 1-like n=1 Tax=Ptychodera flava TaxID=63121 RepID=UPI003969C006